MKTENPVQLLEERPFSYRATREAHVLISWRGALKRRLTGGAAQRFLEKIQGAGDEEAQLLMARATGNFKRGNERSAKG